MTDWVETRYNCTAKQAVLCLAREAEKNVETRKEQIRNDNVGMRPPKFHGNGDKGFSVECGLSPNGDFEKFVLFKLEDLRTIHVSGTTVSDEFDVRVEMDTQGNCALSVDDLPMEHWQVLHKALDRLLFP